MKHHTCFSLRNTFFLPQGLDEINSSKAALQCLLDGQDYAGALELLEHMRHIVGGHLQDGLKCFRSLPPQVGCFKNVQDLWFYRYESRALLKVKGDLPGHLDTDSYKRIQKVLYAK